MAKNKSFPFALGENAADAIKRLNDSKRDRSQGFGKDSKQQKTLEFTDNDMSTDKQEKSSTESNDTPTATPASTKSFTNHQIGVDNLDAHGTQKVELTPQQLKDLIEAQVLKQADRDSAVIAKVQAKLAAKEGDVELLQERLDALERDYQEKLKKSKQEANNLFRVFSDLGVSVTESGDIVKETDPLYFGSSESDSKKTVLAGVNDSHARSRNSRITHSGMDAFKEAARIFRDQTPKRVLAHPMTGALVDVYDTSAIDSFVKANHRQCIAGLDSQLKKEGFLRGRAVDSSTSQLTMPPMYLEMLSSLLRVTHMSQFVMHQFADTIPALGYNVGDTVQIPRSDFGAVSVNAEDWELDLGSPLADNSQPLMMGHVKAVLKEYGMGKTGTAMLPIAIPQFIMSTSLHQLLQIVQTNLGRNYREFEELLLRRLWEGTSLIRYNVNHGVSDIAPVAGGKGGLTREFLISLAAYMHGDLKVPTFDDGNYVLVTNSLSLAVLKNSIGENSRFIDKRSIEELTNLFNFSTGSDLGRIYGYQMTVGNFHIFSQNSYGVGAIVGDQYGVSEAGGILFRSSFAVGRNTIGRAIAKPFSIIRSSNDDFGRMNRYSWGSYEAFAQLDVDPNQGTPESANQQARVVEIRTSDIIL